MQKRKHKSYSSNKNWKERGEMKATKAFKKQKMQQRFNHTELNAWFDEWDKNHRRS